MSALLAGTISDTTDIEFQVVTGSMSASGKSIFKHTPIKESLSSGKDVNLPVWDGHCWVKLKGDIICDPSLFKTIFSPLASENIKSIFRQHFKETTLYLIGQPHRLADKHIYYEEKEILQTKEIDFIIGNIQRLGLWHS